jgi:hypothetical protein
MKTVIALLATLMASFIGFYLLTDAGFENLEAELKDPAEIRDVREALEASGLSITPEEFIGRFQKLRWTITWMLYSPFAALTLVVFFKFVFRLWQLLDSLQGFLLSLAQNIFLGILAGMPRLPYLNRLLSEYIGADLSPADYSRFYMSWLLVVLFAFCSLMFLDAVLYFTLLEED